MRSKKILFIEHEKDFATSLAAVLSDGQHRFFFVEQGKTAFDEAVQIRPDLIILRAELPDSSGYSLCTRIGKSHELGQVPILLLSSEATDEAIEKHRKGKHPADEYLIMPFDMEEFRKRVNALIGVESSPPPESIAATHERKLTEKDALEAASDSLIASLSDAETSGSRTL